MLLAARLSPLLVLIALASVWTSGALAAPFSYPSVPHPWSGPLGALAAGHFAADERTEVWAASPGRFERLIPSWSGGLVQRSQFPLPSSVEPIDIAVADDQVFVLDGAGEQVLVFQAKGMLAGREVARLHVGARPTALAVVTFVRGKGIGLSVGVANSGSGDVSIHRRLRDGSFAAEIRVPIGGEPRAVVAGDFGGGRELAVASASGTVTFLRHDGTTRTTLRVGGSPSSLATADAVDESSLNGDQTQDLVVAVSEDEGRLVLGGEKPVLGPFVNLAGTGPGPLKLAMGRFDGDSLLDLVVAGAKGVFRLHGLGIGFGRPELIDADIESVALAAGNFGGDWHNDVVVADAHGAALRLLLSPGDRPLGHGAEARNVTAGRGRVVWSQRVTGGYDLGGSEGDLPVPLSTRALVPAIGTDLRGRVSVSYARCGPAKCRPYVWSFALGSERQLPLPIARGCRLGRIITARKRIAFDVRSDRGRYCPRTARGVWLRTATGRLRRMDPSGVLGSFDGKHLGWLDLRSGGYVWLVRVSELGGAARTLDAGDSDCCAKSAPQLSGSHVYWVAGDSDEAELDIGRSTLSGRHCEFAQWPYSSALPILWGFRRDVADFAVAGSAIYYSDENGGIWQIDPDRLRWQACDG